MRHDPVTRRRGTRAALVLGLTLTGCAGGNPSQPTAPPLATPATREVQQISQTIGPNGELFQQVGGISQQLGGGGVSQQLGWPFSGSQVTVGSGGTTTVVGGSGPSTVISTGGGTAFASSTTRSGNREEVVQTIGVSGNRALDIFNTTGDLVLRRASGPNLEVRITKVADGDPADLGKVNVASSVTGNVALRTESSDPNARVRVLMDIAVPSNISLGTIQTTGNIAVTGLTGGALSARNGALSVN